MPKDTNVSQRLDGDLDGDGKDDAVLVTDQGLIVVFQRGDRWVKHGEAPLMIPSGGGAFCGLGCAGTTEISGGEIAFSYEYGSREVGEVECSFRYDAKRRRFRQTSVSERVHDRLGLDPDSHTVIDFDTRTRIDDGYQEKVAVKEVFLGDGDACTLTDGDPDAARALAPAGWKAEDFKRADMNGDGAREGVITVRRSNSECGFVILAKKGERYTKSDEVIRYPCNHHFRVQNGIVTVQRIAGDGTRCKFRRDRRSGAFVLIGREVDRESDGVHELISTNFLTRRREITREQGGKTEKYTERIDASSSEELNAISVCEER